jgi:hypothetical protein
MGLLPVLAFFLLDMLVAHERQRSALPNGSPSRGELLCAEKPLKREGPSGSPPGPGLLAATTFYLVGATSKFLASGVLGPLQQQQATDAIAMLKS